MVYDRAGAFKKPWPCGGAAPCRSCRRAQEDHSSPLPPGDSSHRPGTHRDGAGSVKSRHARRHGVGHSRPDRDAATSVRLPLSSILSEHRRRFARFTAQTAVKLLASDFVRLKERLRVLGRVRLKLRDEILQTLARPACLSPRGLLQPIQQCPDLARRQWLPCTRTHGPLHSYHTNPGQVRSALRCYKRRRQIPWRRQFCASIGTSAKLTTPSSLDSANPSGGPSRSHRSEKSDTSALSTKLSPLRLAGAR